MRSLRLPTAADPQVSLVVVVYGGYGLARRTLAAIAAGADVDYEVIVVDNASPDGAGQRLKDETVGARFILNSRNLGFGAGINLGALHARGPLVGLLNADIEPEPGFLSPLVATLAANPQAGAVTPLYLDSNGAVIEAGGLIGAHGGGYGYGVGWSADHPSVAFRREVDYGSAAAIVVRRERFHQVGGLDLAYGMGYYEDADLCFALREAGFVTLYEPRSRVRHLEHGSFTRAARLELLERNRPLFTNRYPTQLCGRPLVHRPPFDPHAEIVVRDWWAPQRLLVIDRDGILDSFATAVRRLWPRSRVTVVGGTVKAAHARDTWVESGPRDCHPGRLGRWLEERRFHYGAVVTCGDDSDRYTQLLARTQPQALFGVIGDPARLGHGWVSVPADARRAMARLGFPAPPG